MLKEQDRQKLDGIVQKMMQGGESDDNIQFVVDDFKSKYDVADVVAQPTQQKKSLLENVSDFVGTTSLGKGLGLAAFKYLSPEGKDLVKKVEGGTANTDELNAYADIFSKAPTAKQVIGSGIQTATSIGSLGVGAVKGANAAVRIGKAALQSGAIGAVIGTARGLEEDKSISGALKQGATNGAISGVIGGGIQGGSELLRTLTQNLPKRLMQSVLKQTKAEKLAGKDASEYALKKAKFGTVDSMISGTKISIDDLNGQIDNQLAKYTEKGVKVSNDVVFTSVAESINKAGGEITAQEVKDITLSLAPQAKGLLNKNLWSVQEANSVRKLLDKTLGNKSFISQQLPFNKDVAMEVTNTLRDKVQTYVGETAPLFKDLSKEITIRNALLNKAATGSGNQILSLTDFLSGILGAGGGLPGTLGMVAAKKAFTSTPVVTGSALLMNKINNLSTKIAPYLEKLKPAERMIILNAIKEVTSSSE